MKWERSGQLPIHYLWSKAIQCRDVNVHLPTWIHCCGWLSCHLIGCLFLNNSPQVMYGQLTRPSPLHFAPLLEREGLGPRLGLSMMTIVLYLLQGLNSYTSRCYWIEKQISGISSLHYSKLSEGYRQTMEYGIWSGIWNTCMESYKTWLRSLHPRGRKVLNQDVIIAKV